MFFNTKQSQRTVLMLLDLFAVIISFFAAVYTRFYNESDWHGINSWNGGLYYLLLELVLAVNIVVFLLNDTKHRPIHLQNPLEKLINVIKNNLLQTAFLVVLLYLIKQGFWASRAVVLALFIYNVCLDFILRFFYGRFLYKKIGQNVKIKKYILLTSPKNLLKDLRRLKIGQSKYVEIAGIVTTEENEPFKDLVDIKVLGGLESFFSSDGIKQYDEIIYFAEADNDEKKKIINIFNEKKYPITIVPVMDGNTLSTKVFEKIGCFESFRFSFMSEKNSVLGVNFAVTNLWEAVIYIQNNINKLAGKYICFSNVHTTVMAHEDPEYRKIQNEAAIVFPDGAPISKLQKRRGNIRAGRVAGPDFMREMFLSSADKGISMYFYGSSPETIEALKKNIEKKYPGLDVRGYESPPFRNLTREEDDEAVRRINESGADIVWVGLGAPKQEKWMNEHKERIHALMLGVGAGFDFHAGTVKRAPEWMQHVGLEWLYRLFQDPKRLIRRYFVTNIKFMYYLISKK